MRSMRICALILLAVLSGNIIAAGTSNGITGPSGAEFRAGLWWDPARSGSGWDFSQVGNALFGVWYTYDADGDPTWYTLAGVLEDGRVEADLHSFTWDYTAQKLNKPTVAGQASIHFPHPQLAEVQWTLGDSSRQQTLEPFRFSPRPALEDRSGIWYRPLQPGYGLTVQTQGDKTFGVMFHYDEAGQPTWAAGNDTEGNRRLNMLTGAGSCPSCAYRTPEFQPAGELKLGFSDETQGRITGELGEGANSWSWNNTRIVMLSSPPSGRPHAAALATIASTDALKHYYKAGYEAGNGQLAAPICFDVVLSPAPAEGSSPDQGNLSGTNVQESNVDEADMVKATPSHLFAIDHSSWELPFSADAQAWQQSITRYSISDDGTAPAADGSYTVPLPRGEDSYSQVSMQGLYRHDTAAGKQALVHLAGQFAGGCFEPSRQHSYISAFDAGPDADFDIERQLLIDGELIASRRIGDRLLLVTAYQPDIFQLASDVLGPEAIASKGLTQELVDELFEQLQAGDLLPQISYRDGSGRSLVGPENIMMPPLSLERIHPVLTTLSIFDLDDLGAAPQSLSIMGSVDGVYASLESVYFASSAHGVALGEFGQLLPDGLVNTDIHKISVASGAPDYRGSGTVEGVVGFDRERLPWRMGEQAGDLRIVTSHGWTRRWGELGEHRLTILRESGKDDLLLDTVAVLPNEQRPQTIGKPGEAVHAVRYMGDRAWVVTFEQVDPLYALDLSVPEDPRILGELQIEGFSNYLHPVGENLLIGVGMQAKWDEWGTWLQGVQVSLFDVEQAASPVLLDQVEVGYRGSSTPVLGTHRAFTYLQGNPDTGREPRFVLPLTIHSPEKGEVDEDPSTWYPWESTGILMLYLDGANTGNARLELAGRADLANRDSTLAEHVSFYDYLGLDDSRSVIFGEHVFHYFRGGLFGTDWGGEQFTPAEGCTMCEPRF